MHYGGDRWLVATLDQEPLGPAHSIEQQPLGQAPRTKGEQRSERISGSAPRPSRSPFAAASPATPKPFLFVVAGLVWCAGAGPRRYPAVSGSIGCDRSTQQLAWPTRAAVDRSSARAAVAHAQRHQSTSEARRPPGGRLILRGHT